MLLAFDVGNTNIVLGAFQERELIQSWRIETDNGKTADEFGMLIHQFFEYDNLNPKDVGDIIISTVVPSIKPLLVVNSVPLSIGAKFSSV